MGEVRTMTPPLSPAIAQAIKALGRVNFCRTATYGEYYDAEDTLIAAILAEQQALIGRIERLSARLDECERGVVEP